MRYPVAVLRLPLLLSTSAATPVAVLLLPVVLPASVALTPVAVLRAAIRCY